MVLLFHCKTQLWSPLRAAHFFPSTQTSRSTIPHHHQRPAHLSKSKEVWFYILVTWRVLPHSPGLCSLPFKWLFWSVFFFFFSLLVSSNTYIVWGETESIHSPQKAIHLKAAGEAKCSPCPLHSWMSFVQSSGLEPFPPQIQAINESAMEKGKKISQCFACPQFVHFLFARKFFWLGPRWSRKTATFLGKEKGSNVCLINMYLCFFFYTRGQLSVWK